MDSLCILLNIKFPFHRKPIITVTHLQGHHIGSEDALVRHVQYIPCFPVGYRIDRTAGYRVKWTGGDVMVIVETLQRVWMRGERAAVEVMVDGGVMLGGGDSTKGVGGGRGGSGGSEGGSGASEEILVPNLDTHIRGREYLGRSLADRTMMPTQPLAGSRSLLSQVAPAVMASTPPSSANITPAGAEHSVSTASLPTNLAVKKPTASSTAVPRTTNETKESPFQRPMRNPSQQRQIGKFTSAVLGRSRDAAGQHENASVKPDNESAETLHPQLELPAEHPKPPPNTNSSASPHEDMSIGDSHPCESSPKDSHTKNGNEATTTPNQSPQRQSQNSFNNPPQQAPNPGIVVACTDLDQSPIYSILEHKPNANINFPPSTQGTTMHNNSVRYGYQDESVDIPGVMHPRMQYNHDDDDGAWVGTDACGKDALLVTSMLDGSAGAFNSLLCRALGSSEEGLCEGF